MRTLMIMRRSLLLLSAAVLLGPTSAMAMSPLILIVATLNLNAGLINITAHPAATLNDCVAFGEAMITAATKASGTYASYACHDPSGQTGVLAVVAYLSPEGHIKISEAAKPTADACGVLGKTALATKVVPGAMSWACFDLSKF